MTLTVTMLTYLVRLTNKISKDSTPADDGEDGPMWNRFWNRTFSAPAGLNADQPDDDSVSQSSDQIPTSSLSASRASGQYPLSKLRNSITPAPLKRSMRRDSSVLSQQSEERGLLSPTHLFSPTTELGTFSFKLRVASSKKVYRFTSGWNSLAKMYTQVCAKTGSTTKYSDELATELDITLAGTALRLCYIDDEGDVVVLESDKDLEEAVSMSKRMGSRHLAIYLGEPAVDAQSSVSSRSRGASPQLVNTQNTIKRDEGVWATLAQAPLPVNIAISAGIVLITTFLISRMK
jgi:PB1 domain